MFPGEPRWEREASGGLNGALVLQRGGPGGHAGERLPFGQGHHCRVISVSAGKTCPNKDTPNAIGGLQIIEGDDVGGNTEEVTKNVFRERQRGGYKYYKTLQGEDATLFRKPTNVCAGFALQV